jgi:hypothetical protein
MATSSSSLTRWMAFGGLLLVGCAADASKPDEGSCPAVSGETVPLEAGSFRSLGGPGSPAPGADGYGETERRMTVDLAANTVEVVFLDRASRRRVERYRIVR